MDHEAYKMWKCSDSYEKPIIACKRFAAKAKYCVCACVSAQLLSHVQLFATPLTVTHQAPLSIGFPRQESWNGLSFPPPGGFPDPEIEPGSPASPTLTGRFFYYIQQIWSLGDLSCLLKIGNYFSYSVLLNLWRDRLSWSSGLIFFKWIFNSQNWNSGHNYF